LTIRDQDLKDLTYPYIELSSYEDIRKIIIMSNQREELIKMTFWNNFVDENKIMRKTPTLPVSYQEIIFSILIESNDTNSGENYEELAFKFHNNSGEFIEKMLPIDLFLNLSLNYFKNKNIKNIIDNIDLINISED